MSNICVYLADLAHNFSADDQSLMVPLGIGYIKAYAMHNLPGQVDIKLFKSPEKMLEAVAVRKPDVIGLANYGWNEHLNHTAGTWLRARFPDILIVAGGPNIDPEPERKLAFLKLHKYLDFSIIDSGEEAFTGLLTWWREGTQDPLSLPSNVMWRDGETLHETEPLKQKKEIGNIPSPYLSGHLDEFIDAGMVPLLETNRGCPFECTFCAWGMASKNLVRRFPVQGAIDEINYIGSRSKSRRWIIADANFGILKRDVEIAKTLRAVKDKYHNLDSCSIWLSKNTTDRNLEIAAILGDISIPVMAVQSMSPIVLKNIKRDNIQTSTYVDYQQKFHDQGNRTYSDLIVPLPGETLESHIDGLRQIFEFDVDIIVSHNMRLLAGAETNSQKTRDDFDFKTRYRLIHGDAGIYHTAEGEELRTFECEESLRSTSTMSEEDLFYLRKLHFLVELCWNFELYKPLLIAARSYSVSPLDILRKLLEKSEQEGVLKDFWSLFDQSSREEWFDSEESIREHFSDNANFEKLVNNNFEKLNIQFTVEVLRHYKEEMDEEIKRVVIDLCDIPKAILEQVFSFTFSRFPQINDSSPGSQISVSRDFRDIRNIKKKNFQLSEVRVPVSFMSSPQRERVQQVILDASNQTLSKVLNTQGISLKDLSLETNFTT
jgi:hypothetical protein